MAKQMSFSSIRLPSKSDIFISGHAIIFTINFINRFTICHHMKVTISFCNTSKCGFSANTSVAALLTYKPEGFDRLIYNLPLPLLIAAIANCPVLAAAISHTRVRRLVQYPSFMNLK